MSVKKDSTITKTELYALPADGFLKESQIIKLPKSTKPCLIPVSRSTWRSGIIHGIYPRPVKLGVRSIAWRVSDIKLLIEKLGAQ